MCWYLHFIYMVHFNTWTTKELGAPTPMESKIWLKFCSQSSKSVFPCPRIQWTADCVVLCMYLLKKNAPTGQPSPSQEMDQLFQNFLLMLLGRRPWGNNMSKAWRNPFSEPVASGWFKIARQNPHPIHCWWQCKLVQPLRKTVWSVLKN